MKKFDFIDVDLTSRMVAENELAFAFLNKMPILPGHTLICPKTQVVLSEQLTPETWSDLLKLKEIVCLKLRRILYAKGFNFAWNEDITAGQTVPHFHLHVVPRKETDVRTTEYEPCVFLYRPGSRAISPSHELITLSKELRELA